MLDFLEPYLHWGPNGLYSTLALMAIAFVAGWPYAYIAHIGYRKDITQPNAGRRRAAWGAAFIFVVAVLMLRHGREVSFVELQQSARPNADGAVSWVLRSVSDWLYYQQTHTTNFLETLFWALATVVILPSTVGIALILGVVVFMGGLALAGLIAGGSTVALISAPAAAAGAALAALPGFLMGAWVLAYFLFVRLPLQVVYRRAIREGRWPTTGELIWALEKGTLGKTWWQSDIMAYKADKFTSSLNAQTKKLRDTFE